jgi:hypothetical protein
MSHSMRHNQAKSAVRSKLRHVFANRTLLPQEIYARLEERIPHCVVDAIKKEIALFAAERRLPFVTSPYAELILRNVRHQIIVVPDENSFEILRVTVFAAEPSESPPAEKLTPANIEGLGRHSQIELQTSVALLHAQERILEAAKVAVETAYEELNIFTMDTLGGLDNRAGDALYSEVRRLLPQQLADHVWLFAFSGAQGFHVPDERARDVALTNLGRRINCGSRSPLALAADFVTHVLPFERTFTRIALNSGPIVGLFDSAPYADQGLGFAEAAVYNANGLAVQALSTFDGNQMISVGYPVELQSELEAELTAMGPALQGILQSNSVAVSRAPVTTPKASYA